jgi:predicted transcriptional regulator
MVRYLEERERIVLKKLEEHNASAETPKTAEEIGLTNQDMRTLKHLMASGLVGKTEDNKYYITKVLKNT